MHRALIKFNNFKTWSLSNITTSALHKTNYITLLNIKAVVIVQGNTTKNMANFILDLSTTTLIDSATTMISQPPLGNLLPQVSIAASQIPHSSLWLAPATSS